MSGASVVADRAVLRGADEGSFPFDGSAVKCDRKQPYHWSRRTPPPLPTEGAASIATGDTDRMNPETETAPPEPRHEGGAWVRPVVLVASCLIIGFVGGWILRGDGGPVTILSPVASGDAGASGSVTTGGSATAPSPTSTATAPVAPAPPPTRDQISLIVLNATSENGLAGRIAAQAESLGYPGVTAGNAPNTIDPSTVYFAPAQRPAAQRVARDLQIDRVEALPTSGAVADAATEGVDVALVLGPG